MIYFAIQEMKLLCSTCRLHYKHYGELPLLPGTVRSQFTFRPISPGQPGMQEDSEGRGLDNRLSPASDRDDRAEDSDSGRSYSSRSESGSRSPEDVSRATTPGVQEAGGGQQAAGAGGGGGASGGGPSVTDIERDIDEESDSPPPGQGEAAGGTATPKQEDGAGGVEDNSKPEDLSNSGRALSESTGNFVKREEIGTEEARPVAVPPERQVTPASQSIPASVPPARPDHLPFPGFPFPSPNAPPPPPPAGLSQLSRPFAGPPLHASPHMPPGALPSPLAHPPLTSPLLQPLPSPIAAPTARTPVDLTSPSPSLTPGPPPATTPTTLHSSSSDADVQVVEPDPATPPATTPREPTPEPRIEDVECHRSQSAIFVRHWNRGEGNSCARTDLFFKPVPDSKLARKREERLRKHAESERAQEAARDSKSL